MDNMAENALLLDFYGSLLSQRRRDIYHMRFCEDHTLTEIGEKLGISRQAVYVAISISQEYLEGYETKLKMIAHHKAARKGLDQLKTALDSGDIAESKRILGLLDDLIMEG